MSPKQTPQQTREQNRRSWNAITPVHNAHKRDQAAFFRDGGSTLFPDEIELLGDLAGLDVVHLQCNCGQDSLSLAKLGANVTGVDISDEAVSFARTLSTESGIGATFVRSSLEEWFETVDTSFDVAFTSYGSIGWIRDVRGWARGVAKALRPGGRLVFLDFHPVVWSLSAKGLDGDDYFERTAIPSARGVNDYVGEALAPSGFVPRDDPFENPEPAVSFQWTVAGLLQAVIDAGLSPRVVREYPYSNGCEVFEGMKRIDGRRYTTPDGMAEMPLMFGLVATR